MGRVYTAGANSIASTLSHRPRPSARNERAVFPYRADRDLDLSSARDSCFLDGVFKIAELEHDRGVADVPFLRQLAHGATVPRAKRTTAAAVNEAVLFHRDLRMSVERLRKIRSHSSRLRRPSGDRLSELCFLRSWASRRISLCSAGVSARKLRTV